MVIINELKKRNVQNVQILVDKGDKGASTIKSICKLNYTPNALSWIFFGGGRSERKRSAFGWLDEGMVGYWRRCSYAREYARSSTRSFVFFAVTSVTADGIEKTSSPQKKQRVVLWNVTCRFVESDGLF